MPACPLCEHTQPSHFYRDSFREYLLCQQCQLVFVPTEYHLSAQNEKLRYDTHQNNPNDPRYRQFLNRLFTPLCKHLATCAHGLDYGSGPGPTLSKMFEESGHTMALYDIYYAPDTEVLQQQYDFICCTETIEHFSRPGYEWQQFLRITKPGAWIGIMTQMRDRVISFADWNYKNDPTHIAFYSKTTFQWLSQQNHLEVEYHGDSVALFKLP